MPSDVLANQHDIIDPYLETHERILEVIRSKYSKKKLSEIKRYKRDVIKEKKSEYVRRFLLQKNRSIVSPRKIIPMVSEEIILDQTVKSVSKSKKRIENVIEKLANCFSFSKKQKIRRPKKISEIIIKIDDKNKLEKQLKNNKKVNIKHEKIVNSVHATVNKTEDFTRKQEEKEVLNAFAEEAFLPELPNAGLNKDAKGDVKDKLRSVLDNEINKDNRMVL